MDRQSALQAQSTRLFRLVSQLNARSPFRTSSSQAGPYMAVAFEIKWEDICGFNYHNPLCIDGRVVIEAAKLTKRQFVTVSVTRFLQGLTCRNLLPGDTYCCMQLKEAQKYYLKRMSSPEPHSPQPGRRAALRTYASSPNMSLPLSLRAAHPSTAGAHHHQHVQWKHQGGQGPAPSANQPAAMRSLDPDLPSMPEASALPEAAEPPCAQTAPSMPSTQQVPEAAPGHAHSLNRSCLKHAGVGKMSPPQSREQAETAGRSAHMAANASWQASSSEDSFPAQSIPHIESAGLDPWSDPVSESVFSGISQWPAEEQLHRQSGSSEHSAPEHWPETCSWTVPCHIFKYRTVTFNFKDPSLPGVLQPAIHVRPLCQASVPQAPARQAISCKPLLACSTCLDCLQAVTDVGSAFEVNCGDMQIC